VHEVSLIIDAPRDAVYDALSRPETYPRWVVGAQRIRSVEGNWPEEGATFHHVVGVWPARLRDSTTVLTSAPPAKLVLEARARPMGRAKVELELEDLDGERTRVHMREDAVSGPATLIPSSVRAVSIKRRNELSLDRLRRVVVGEL